MVTIVLPVFDLALVIAALLTCCIVAIAHLIFKPGFVRRTALSRPVAYMIGVGSIGLVFSLLYVLARNDWQAVLDLWVLVVAASIPTIGLRFVKRYADQSSQLEVMRGDSTD